jgi:hypothetical protein
LVAGGCIGGWPARTRASDDLIEVEGCEGADEFTVDKNNRWQGDLVAPGGTEQMRVRAEYDPDGSGCWVISLSQTDESVPLAAWGNGTGQEPGGYSTLVRVDAPEGTRLTNVVPDPDGGS